MSLPFRILALSWSPLLLALATAPAPAEGLAPRLQAELAAGESAGRLGPGVRQALTGGGAVAVIVAFEAALPSGPRSTRPRDRAARRAVIRRAGDEILARLAPGDWTPKQRFRGVRALAGRVRGRGLVRLLGDPRVRRVDLDEGGRGQLLEALPLAGVDAVRDGKGLTGQGVLVAILDSGFDPAHPDLAGAVVDEQCYCAGAGGCCPGGGASQSGPGAASDDHGHGTNVTGIVTGDGGSAPRGAAPDAAIVAIKVLDQDNAFSSSSDVILGLDWLAVEHPDVDVVNLSLGTDSRWPGPCDGASALTMAWADAVAELRDLGAVLVAASGNAGSGVDMGLPACLAGTVSVGAVYDDDLGFVNLHGCTDNADLDETTCFSNADASLDLFAPGAETEATRLGGGGGVFAGTSQAAALVSGCAALLLERVPHATPGPLELALQSSPSLVEAETSGLLYPRLDCDAALALLEAIAPAPPPVPVPGLGAGAAGLLAIVLTLAGLAAGAGGLSPRASSRAGRDRGAGGASGC